MSINGNSSIDILLSMLDKICINNKGMKNFDFSFFDYLMRSQNHEKVTGRRKGLLNLPLVLGSACLLDLDSCRKAANLCGFLFYKCHGPSDVRFLSTIVVLIVAKPHINLSATKRS